MAVNPSFSALAFACLAAIAFTATGRAGEVSMQDDTPPPSLNESLSTHGVVALGTTDDKVTASVPTASEATAVWNTEPEMSSAPARLADPTPGQSSGWVQKIGSWLQASAALVGGR